MSGLPVQVSGGKSRQLFCPLLSSAELDPAAAFWGLFPGTWAGSAGDPDLFCCSGRAGDVVVVQQMGSFSCWDLLSGSPSEAIQVAVPGAQLCHLIVPEVIHEPPSADKQGKNAGRAARDAQCSA